MFIHSDKNHTKTVLISGHSLAGGLIPFLALDAGIRKLLKHNNAVGHIIGAAGPASFTPDMIQYYRCLQVEDGYTLTVKNFFYT